MANTKEQEEEEEEEERVRQEFLSVCVCYTFLLKRLWVRDEGASKKSPLQ